MSLLEKHPEIGMVSSISSFFMWFIESSTPYLKYAGILIGLLIGLVTLYIKIVHAVKDTKELKRKKKQ